MVPIRKLNTPIGVRKIISIVVSLEIISVFVESSESDNYVSELLKKTKIIPDVLDVAPKYALDVRYGTQAIKFGTLLPPTFVYEAPNFVDWKHGPKTYFTLIMTDPDCPATSNPYNREWQHWVVGNIPTNKVDAGKVLTPYLGAIHPKEDGMHRYVFTVYKQRGEVNFTDPILDKKPVDVLRANFSTRNFASRYNLGDPHAVNYFVVNWGGRKSQH